MRRADITLQMVCVSNDIYKLIFWNSEPRDDCSATDYPTNWSCLQIWENVLSVLIWSLSSDTEILSPKNSMGKNYLASFGRFKSCFIMMVESTAKYC